MIETAPPGHQPTTARPRTAVDALADAHLEAALRLDPLAALGIGAADVAPGLGDRSPAGIAEAAGLARATLAALRHTDPVDDVDEVTVAALRERLGLEVELHEAGELTGRLDVIASPVQELRMVFDLLPTDTAAQWEEVAQRLAAVPAAVAGYVESLRAVTAQGRPPARRQVAACAREAAGHGAPGGFFETFAATAATTTGALPAAVHERVRAAAAEAAEAYRHLARYLREDLLPRAGDVDAVGPDRYRLWSRHFLGAEVDLAETYAWGQEEVAELRAQMRRVADRIVPGGTVEEAVAALDADPATTITGVEAFRDWMQERSDATVAALAGTHFDIPEEIRRLECRLAPTTSGGIYYTGPSEDFSRPGRMWWAVPEGVSRFTTWREATTVHHEGVPGHHLQIGQVAVRGDVLNRWRRHGCWVSGHGEGWALYAERLMEELGHLHSPGEVLGMLEGQLLRAGRVVLDIGLHCGFEAPAEVGGGRWDHGKAWAYLRSTATMDEAFLRFELDRYLGWPGQAPSYKVGERLWRSLREEVRAREGAAFDAVGFHRRALDLGSLGLDVLRGALLPA